MLKKLSVLLVLTAFWLGPVAAAEAADDSCATKHYYELAELFKKSERGLQWRWRRPEESTDFTNLRCYIGVYAAVGGDFNYVPAGKPSLLQLGSEVAPNSMKFGIRDLLIKHGASEKAGSAKAEK